MDWERGGSPFTLSDVKREDFLQHFGVTGLNKIVRLGWNTAQAGVTIPWNCGRIHDVVSVPVSRRVVVKKNKKKNAFQ